MEWFVAQWHRYWAWRNGGRSHSPFDALEQMPLEPGTVIVSYGVKGDVLNPHDRPEDDWPPGDREAAGIGAGNDRPGGTERPPGARQSWRPAYVPPWIWWKQAHTPSRHATAAAAANCRICRRSRPAAARR
jgi:hypothetical protein